MKETEQHIETETKFLIYVDILGFEELARQIAKNSKIVSERKIREDFICTINQKIIEAEQRGGIEGKSGKRDDWLLVVDSLDSVFETIYQILNHNTEYEGYEKIPLEIAVGSGQYDKWSKLNGNNLICEKPTIDFLKTHITEFYREWHKTKYSRSITNSFVVFSESVYEKMGYFEKEMCEKIEYPLTNEKGQNSVSFFVADASKVIRRGSLFNFLRKIGKSNSSWFRGVDTAYVPPNEYGSIIDTLENRKVVFLVGDPEIGKTYTAARILWEYYLKGYTPIWNSGTEDQERAVIRKKLCEFEIFDQSVTYFEDPFGKRRFEDREELRRIMANIISKIQQLDARVIISSREQVFKEFTREVLSQRDLSEFIVEMKLMKPSYTPSKMAQILINWAREYECRWLSKDELKIAILLEVSERLTTPLSLWDFAFSSKEYVNPSEIKELIKEKSKAIKASFAEEIAQMPKERILFLSLISILRHIRPAEIKKIYHRICESFRLNDSYQNSFEALEREFAAKITLSNKGHHDAEYYSFTHPSYEDGVVSSWNRDEVKGFLLETFNLLIMDNEPLVRGSCGLSLIKNFDDLAFKDEAKGLIQTLLRDKKALTRLGLSIGLEDSFKNIPITIGLEFASLLMKDRNGEIRARVISIIASNFASIPYEKAIELISRGLEDRSALVRFEAVRGVRLNIDSFPLAFAEKALKVNEELCNYSGYAISYFSGFSYDDLKEAIEKRKSTVR